MTALNPNGNPIRVGRITLRTHGLAGTATALPVQTGAGTRGRQLTTPALDEALASSNVETQDIVEISQTREVPVPGGAQTRTTSSGAPALVVEVPDPGQEWGQMLLYTDEAGIVTWNFPRAADSSLDISRGQATRTYVIPRYVAPVEGTGQTRGLAGLLGSKVLKVLVFPLVEPAIGLIGDYFVAKWEQKNRPYRVRPFTSDNYQSGSVSPLNGEGWRALSRGRALLMVHGTMSQSHTGFGGLPRDFVELMNSHYEGRVFAFDQVTLSEDPLRNVQWFINQMPDGTALDLDIICHSRGGLVSRILVEKQSELAIGSKRVSIANVVFVAAPNAGTILTDTKYMGDYIDTWTNLVSVFPSPGVIDVLQVVIALVKQVAVGAFKGLDGLESMLPKGDFLSKLNAGAKAKTTYFAMASDYEPADAGVKAWLKNRLMDSIFKAKNDLVVPTAGVYDQNGNQSFPIADRYVFSPSDSVAHSQYFENPVARRQIADWLFAAAPTPSGVGETAKTVG